MKRYRVQATVTETVLADTREEAIEAIDTGHAEVLRIEAIECLGEVA